MIDDHATSAKPEVEALREEIRQTRAELGVTVQALAAKADVKARVSQTAAQARERVKESAAQAGERVKESASRAATQVRGSTGYAVRRAQGWVVAGPDGAHSSAAIRLRELADPATAGRRFTAIGESARRRPAPWLVAVGGVTVAVVVYLAVRRRRL